MICTDTMMMKEGLLCQPDKLHFVCHGCFEKYVESEVDKDIDYLMKTRGELRCPHSMDCKSHFGFDYICQETSPMVVSLYFRGQQRIIEEEARIKEQNRFQKAIEEDRKEERELQEQMQAALLGNQQTSRQRLLEYLLTEKEYENDENTRVCPSCNRIIQRIEGCRAVQCGQDYYGGNRQYGCGRRFDFLEAPRYRSKVAKLDEMIVELVGPNHRRADVA
jgi:hypothetical protein